MEKNEYWERVHDTIEMGVPHLARKIGEHAAREQLTAFLPTLLR